MDEDAPQLGLVLTGGGARAAYQVGVLKGIAELVRRGSGCPFQIVTGTSAGAVSAVALASDPAHFRQAVYAIERVWRDFRVHQVIRTDAASVLKSGLHWVLAVLTMTVGTVVAIAQFFIGRQAVRTRSDKASEQVLSAYVLAPKTTAASAGRR
jgi:predicted acylesterase/phospholipase RssA